MELGNPPPNPPDVWNERGIATGDFTTRSPARSPARSSTAAWPGKIPPFGAETTVVTPPLRQVSMRLSLGMTSSAGTAKHCGSPPCAYRAGAAQKRANRAVKQTAKAHLRIGLDRMQDSSRKCGETPAPGNRNCRTRRMRLVGSFGRVKKRKL